MMRPMKDSGIAWIGKIPEGWRAIKFKYFYIHKKEIAGDRADDYERLALTLNGVIKRPKDDPEGLQPGQFDGYQILQEDDFVFKMIDLQNISTSRVGLSAYKGLVSPAYIRFSSKGVPHSRRFFYYFLMSLYYNCVYNNLGGDGVRSALNANDLGDLIFPIPPLAEQQAIADYLDEKCAAIDKLIDNQKAQIEKMKEYKQSVITEAVTKGLNPSVPMKDSGIAWIGKIPEEWIIEKAKYTFKQRSEKGNGIKLQLLSPTQNYGVIPQIEYDRLSGMKSVKLSEEIELKELKTIHIGDYCISLRSFQGGFEYSQYEGVVSPAYKVFYSSRTIVEGYYKYLFKSEVFIQEMNSYTVSFRDGKSISFEAFAGSIIPIPPLAEQQAIADYLDEKCAAIDKLIAIKQAKIDKLNDYKKSLIYEYVTGKREVL